MVAPRYQSRRAFLEETFGDQVTQCPHCSEPTLVGYLCHVCRKDPDHPVITHIVLECHASGEFWEVTSFDKKGHIVDVTHHSYREDANDKVSDIAGRCYPRPTLRHLRKGEFPAPDLSD